MSKVIQELDGDLPRRRILHDGVWMPAAAGAARLPPVDPNAEELKRVKAEGGDGGSSNHGKEDFRCHGRSAVLMGLEGNENLNVGRYAEAIRIADLAKKNLDDADTSAQAANNHAPGGD